MLMLLMHMHCLDIYSYCSRSESTTTNLSDTNLSVPQRSGTESYCNPLTRDREGRSVGYCMFIFFAKDTCKRCLELMLEDDIRCTAYKGLMHM